MDVFRLFCRAKMPLIYFNNRCVLPFAFRAFDAWPLDWSFACMVRNAVAARVPGRRVRKMVVVPEADDLLGTLP